MDCCWLIIILLLFNQQNCGCSKNSCKEDCLPPPPPPPKPPCGCRRGESRQEDTFIPSGRPFGAFDGSNTCGCEENANR